MKYLKAEAEVIEFDNGDIVTWSCQICHLTGEGDSVPYHETTQTWTMPLLIYWIALALGYDGDRTLIAGQPCPGGPGSPSTPNQSSAGGFEESHADWL